MSAGERGEKTPALSEGGGTAAAGSSNSPYREGEVGSPARGCATNEGRVARVTWPCHSAACGVRMTRKCRGVAGGDRDSGGGSSAARDWRRAGWTCDRTAARSGLGTREGTMEEALWAICPVTYGVGSGTGCWVSRDPAWRVPAGRGPALAPESDASAEAPFRRPAAKEGVAGRSAWVGKVGAEGLPSSEASKGGRCWVSRDPACRGPASIPEGESRARRTCRGAAAT